MKNYQRLLAVIAGWVFLLSSQAAAITINLQYPAGTLFSAAHDPTAKAAINKAALDLSDAITTNLSAINTDVFTGTNGNAETTFNWSYQLTNPVSGGTTTVDIATIAANTVTMHVGARNIATLGVGGPGGAGFTSSFSYNPANPSQVIGATASAEAQSEIAYKRGGGPVIGTLAGGTNVEGVPVSYSVDFGIAYGSLTLDWSGSGDGNWHFNHTTPVAAGKNDLYSVALHEMLHALGIGSSDAWESKNPVGTTNWTGANVIALTGSGMNLLNPAGDHIAENTMSMRILDGLPQEVVMDPNITVGTRKSLTALDLAFLRDIDYSTVLPPSSPADFDNDGDVDGSDLLTWRNSYGANANGDTNGDGDTDGRDFLTWQREYTGAMLTATVAVPEPAAGVLILISLVLLGQRRNSR